MRGEAEGGAQGGTDFAARSVALPWVSGAQVGEGAVFFSRPRMYVRAYIPTIDTTVGWVEPVEIATYAAT